MLENTKSEKRGRTSVISTQLITTSWFLSSEQHHYVLLWPPINQELEMAHGEKEFVQGSERRKTKETWGFLLERCLKQSSREGWVFTSQIHQENTHRLTCTELCRRLHTAQTFAKTRREVGLILQKKIEKPRYWWVFWGEDINAHQKLLPEGCQLHRSKVLPPFPVDRNFSLVSSFTKAILV